MEKNKKQHKFKKGLFPLTGKVRKKKIFGFDTETFNNNQNLFCGSIVGENYIKLFFDRVEFQKIITTDRSLRGSYLCATNLGFDLSSIFGAVDMIKYFNPIERNGTILYCVTYVTYDKKDTNIYSKHDRDLLISSGEKTKKDFYKITFIDSLNHFKSSVENLGKIINLPKLKHPDFLGFLPKSYEDINEMLIYNINDSKVTFKFMCWLRDEYFKLGCNLKVTISSSTMDLFRRKFLKVKLYQENKEKIHFCYKAYYGGRTEAFKRGLFTKEKDGFINVYDVNSLYPFVMQTGKFPFPESYFKEVITLDDLKNFEGVTDIVMFCPLDLKIPFLPVKTNKLMFPVGLIKGRYSFIEIRFALTLGYKILKFGKGLIYENVFNPFKNFVTDLYNYRLERKKANDNTQIVPKILMNSLYGKFSFNYLNSEMLVEVNNLGDYDLDKVTIYPYCGNKIFRVTGTCSKPPSYVFPILSLYVTAQAKILMYKKFKEVGLDRVIYSDTDCIFTSRTINTSLKIGELKLEDKYKSVCVVKPKMYGGETLESDNVKVKGLSRGYDSFKEFMEDVRKGELDREVILFRKLRSSLSNSNKHINEVYKMRKVMELDDDKRLWDKKHFGLEVQDSKPLIFTNENYIKKDNNTYI